MPYGIHGFCIRCPCVSGYTPLTNLHSLILTLIPIIMLKNIIIILSVILNLVFIPAFIVDYTAQEEEENLFNTHSVWNDDEESIPQEGSHH
jgi:type IV secretory pathway VirB3-like protein